MSPIISPLARALTITSVIVTAQSCAHQTDPRPTAAFTRCEGTPVLIVHNNTRRDVEVYESRSSVRVVIGTVSPGTHTIALTKEDPRLAYGAQLVGGTEVLTVTSRPRTSDNVRIERGCQ
jgi:hypothetical protein